MLLCYEFAAAWMRTRPKTDRGASLVEYALLVGLIAVVAIASLLFITARDYRSNPNSTFVATPYSPIPNTSAADGSTRVGKRRTTRAKAIKMIAMPAAFSAVGPNGPAHR